VAYYTVENQLSVDSAKLDGELKAEKYGEQMRLEQ